LFRINDLAAFSRPCMRSRRCAPGCQSSASSVPAFHVSHKKPTEKRRPQREGSSGLRTARLLQMLATKKVAPAQARHDTMIERALPFLSAPQARAPCARRGRTMSAKRSPQRHPLAARKDDCYETPPEAVHALKCKELLSRKTSRSPAQPRCSLDSKLTLAVYSGQDRLGTVVCRGDRFEAFDPAGRSRGVYASLQAAVRALPDGDAP
jgi:hypothetical protein